MILDSEKDKTNKPSIDEQVINITQSLIKKFDELIQYEKKKYPNWIRTYVLQAETVYKKLPFNNDSGNTPITKIYVVNVGGGLKLSLNNDEGFYVEAGKTYEGEFTNIFYMVDNGTANITLFARIN